MVWNVYHRDFGAREITVFNIFDHLRFRESVEKLKKKKLPKEEFAKLLEREVMYYFWCKYEYEVVVTSFPPYLEAEAIDKVNKEREEYFEKFGRSASRTYIDLDIGIKIDVYHQIELNWDVFVDYVWENEI